MRLKINQLNKFSSLIHTCIYTIIFPIFISVVCLLFPKFAWSSEPLHSVVECIGALISFTVAFLLSSKSNCSLNGISSNESFWIRMALLSMGFFDLIHAVVSPGNNFVWFHSLAVFCGGIFFAAIFINVDYFRYKKGFLVSILLICISIIVWSILKPQTVPKMLLSGQFTLLAALLNILGSIGYLLAAVFFFSKAIKNSRDTWVVLSSHCALFCWSGLLFEFSSLWDTAWWWWHILRLAAYVVLIYFVYTPLKQFEKLNYSVFFNMAKTLAEKSTSDKECIIESFNSVSSLTGIDNFYLITIKEGYYHEIEYIQTNQSDYTKSIKALNLDDINNIEDHDSKNNIVIPAYGKFLKIKLKVLNEYKFLVLLQNDNIKINRRDKLIQSFYEQLGIALTNQHALKELKKMAHFDGLTTLPNRNYFNKALTQAIKKNKINKTRFFLIFIDMNKFKKINDSYGHLVGDKYLNNFAASLKSVLFEIDFLARIGGDEFAIIAQAESKKSVSSILLSKLSSISRLNYVEDQILIPYQFAIGIASYPEAGTDATTLLRAADIAMYKAKSTPSNNIQFYSDELNIAYKERNQIEQELIPALERGEIYCVFQPIIDANGKKVIGFEALARWEHPSLGFIAPPKWISIAEETGLIDQVGYKIIEKSLAIIDEITSMHGINISFNVSTKQLFNHKIIELIKKGYLQYPWLKNHICLEITETQLVSDFELVQNFIREANHENIEVHLDDFGMGFSSFNYLNRANFSKIKLPREFIADIAEDSKNFDIVKCIYALSDSLDMDLVIEGVELDSELDVLSKLHKGKNQLLFQGYYFSKPLQAKDIKSFMAKYAQKQ